LGGSKNGKSGAAIDPNVQSKVIIDSIEDGVILIDETSTIQLINPAAAKLCGWKTDESTNISAELVIKLVNEKSQPIPTSVNPISQVFKTGKSISSSEYFLLSRDNKVVPVGIHVSPIIKNGTVVQAVAVLNDISVAKGSEQQRADFISTASHEMRTPVAAIEGYLALALNEKVSTVDNRARGYLEKAHASTQHLGQLFQDLLTSAKAEDGRLTSHPTVIDMSEFLTQLTNDLRLIAEKKGLAMDFVAGNSNAEINATSEKGGERVLAPIYYTYVDADRMREVITNLFDNAVKYTEDGKITIGLTGNNQVVQFYIKDTGPGIPADDIPHLFQKFYRVDNSATRTIGGTGLGLFICRKIVERYNGRIWAESVVGQGSTFYINLPRLNPKQASEIKAVGHDANALAPISSLASA
jgi:PAS domain S-box-containing protein